MNAPPTPAEPFVRPAGRRYLGVAAGVPLLVVCLTAVGVIGADPYLLWHDDAAARRPFPTSLRLSKSLQVLARDPRIVLLGSSRTLFGLDPRRIGPQAYNYGINALTAPESEAIVAHLLTRTEVNTIVLGLDDFAFDANTPDHHGGMAGDLASPRRLIEMAAASLLSFDAIKDAARGTYARWGGTVDRPLWRADGWSALPPSSAQAIAAGLAVEAAKPAARFTDERFACLDRLLTSCAARGVRVQLYIPPIHEKLFTVSVSRDGAAAQQRFRAEVFRVARRHGLEVLDFSEPGAVTSQPLTDPNDYYCETSHFTRRTGDLVMIRLGYDVTVPDGDAALLSDFGRPADLVAVRMSQPSPPAAPIQQAASPTATLRRTASQHAALPTEGVLR